MLFVDGENLTLRAQKLAADKELPLREGTHFMRDCFVWLPGMMASQALFQEATPIQDQAVRAYYYTSLVADEAKRTSVREAIWNLGFTPQVFKKDRGQSKSKGVDITLTKDVLSHAFMSNYDVAVLVAGDGDYVPLVEEVKRLGKIVDVMFFQGEGLGLHPELRLACDTFHPLDDFFAKRWISPDRNPDDRM
jgi:uncharacterized LabA/DUF88 family protein